MKAATRRITLVSISLVAIGLFFAGVSYAAIDPGTIAGLWLFDEGTGNVAKDSSGNRNDGTLIGDPQWIAGKFGKALEFNGDDCVSVNDSNSLDMTDQITVMFWFRTDKVMADMWADRQVVVGKHYLEYEVGIYPAGQIHTYTNDGTGGGYDEGVMASMSEELGEADWTVGQWYHVAWTLNGQHEVAYVNGIKIGEHNKAHANTRPGMNPLEIGRRVGGSIPVTGAVDEVVILNVALGEADIKDVMNRGIGTVLTANYALDFGEVGDFYYVLVGSSPVFDKDEVTVEAWIKPTSLPTGTYIFEGRSTIAWNGDGAPGNDPYIFYINEFGQLEAHMDFENGCNRFICGCTVLTLGTWHHVALTVSSTRMRLFLDGRKDADLYNDCGKLVKGHSYLAFGRHMYYKNPFGGIMDEMRIWKTARTEEEIRNNRWAGCIKGDEADLVGYWNFNEGAGQVLHDITQNQNHGTIYGATWTEDSAPKQVSKLLATVGVETEKTINKGNSLSAKISIANVNNLAGFQLGITFDPAILEAVRVEEGTFLSSSGDTYWLKPNIDNTRGIISEIACAKTGKGGVSGDDILATVTFKAVSKGESYIRLQNIKLSDPNGNLIPATVAGGSVTVTEYPPWDVNKDGRVDILDLVLVGQHFGDNVTTPLDPNPDVNGDGKVDISDFVLVGQHFGETYSPAAPSSDIWSFDTKYLPVLIKMYQIMENNPSADPDFLATKRLLHRIISNAKIGKTQVFQNYPNSFNPDTWIPYQLAEDSEVVIRIYSVTGQLIRLLDLGRKEAGSYISKSAAAYWDGTTDAGKRVSSGVYFYSIQAGVYSAAKKMIVVQ